MTIRGQSMAWLLVIAAALGGAATAQDCPDTTKYDAGREVIADLGRIVAPDGIQRAYRTRIGGIDQWVNIRGQDKHNPVLLFVHGGPASPLIPTIWQFQRPLEEYFTVVNWDQRAAGKTFGETDADSIADTIHIDTYVADAIEVAEHVRRELGASKVILVGHSWGTLVGMKAALARPDLFHAYVGIGQVINTRENERLSFDYALERATADDNAEAVAELRSIAPYPGDQPITRERIVLARKWAQHYGGLTAFRDESGYFFQAPKLSPEYTAADVCAIDRGNVFTLGRVLDEFLAVDLSGVRDFPIPVVMIMGRHDYTTPSAPTEAWLDQVQAPFKRGVWFERSAHMAPWEEPGKLLVTLLELVRPQATGEKGLPPGGR